MKIKRIAALLLLILLLCSSCTKESEVTVESPVKTEPGIALKSEHCTITDAMFEYMFYFNFYNAYGDSTEYYNLNLDLTFTEQLYDSDISWQDHLSELALENAKNDIFLTEAALAEGFKYEELEADIEKNIENYKDSAEQVQMTFEDYLVTYFGEKATESVVRKGLEIQLFATAYGNELKNRFTSELTEEDYDDYYNEHRMEIEIVDVLVYSIPINYNGVINTEKRDSLLACKTEEEFKAWIANDLTEKNSLLENPRTEEELQEKINEKCASVSSYYTEGGEFSEWAFDAQREIGDTHYAEKNTGMYDIYMLLRKPYAQEKFTNNVCQILLTSKTYPTEEAALTKANEIVEQFNANGGTKEAFEALAKEYNEDLECYHENAATNFFPEDEMNSWVLSSDRKPGDTTIAQSSYGCHIIMYVSKGLQRWKAEAKVAMETGFVEDKIKEFEDIYGQALVIKDTVKEDLPDSLSPSVATIINGAS